METLKFIVSYFVLLYPYIYLATKLFPLYQIPNFISSYASDLAIGCFAIQIFGVIYLIVWLNEEEAL